MDGTLFGYDGVVASVNSEFQVIDYIYRMMPTLSMVQIRQTLTKNFCLDRKEWFRRTIEILTDGNSDFPDIEEFTSELESLYWSYFGKYNIPFDDALYFLDVIKLHCDIYMITDGYTNNQKNKLFSSGLHRHFPFVNVVFSEEVGITKPNPKVFAHAFKKFDIRPENSIYIGDKIEKDIRGANNALMMSVLLRRGHNAFQPIKNLSTDRPDIEVEDYFELLEHCDFLEDDKAI